MKRMISLALALVLLLSCTACGENGFIAYLTGKSADAEPVVPAAETETDLTPLLNHPELRTLNIKGLDLEDLGILLELPKLERVVIGPGLEEKAAALGDCPFEIVVE